MTAVHFRIQYETLKVDLTAQFNDFFLIFKLEQQCLVIMNNRWKYQCRTADNKAYRLMQSLYANCMLKTEIL